jgi:hypothetical protein
MGKPFFLTTGFFFAAVLCSCQYGTEGLHDFVNDAIIPAVFSGIEVVEGNGSEKDGRLVVGAGQTRLKVTLENSRNTQYGLEVRGADAGLVPTATDFDGFSTIFMTLECPEGGYNGQDETSLDITLHLVSPAGRGQPDDYRLPLVYALEKTQFRAILPNTFSGPVTKLTLLFAEDIPGLAETNITVTADEGEGVRPNALRRITNGIYEVTIDVTAAGKITVEVAPAGYSRASQSVDMDSSSPREITFYYAGAYDSDGTTEKLMLIFNQDIPSPFTIDIAPSVRDGGRPPSGGGNGVRPPVPEPVWKSTGVYELAVGVTQSGTLTITVAKDEYTFSPPSRDVEVHYAIPVEFIEATAIDSAGTTTGLTLTFNSEIVGLDAADIVITGAAGVRTGTVTQSETAPKAYTLELIGVTVSGTVTVTVRKDGYRFSPPSKNVDVRYVR